MRIFSLPDLEKAQLEHNPMLSSLSLKGNQDKWQDKQDNLIVKAALFDGFITWEDWKVEVLASRFLPQFLIQVVEQHPCMIDDGYGNTVFGCYSKDYRNDRERYITLGKLLTKAGLADWYPGLTVAEKIETVVTLLSEYIGEKDAALYVEDMCLADYLLGNPDRHYENFGILVRRDETNKVVGYRPVPLYDFGLGMFQCQPEGKGNDLEQAIRGMHISPFAIDLQGAYSYYQKRWCERCQGMKVNVNHLDFPEGLGRAYLEQALNSLGVITEGRVDV